MRSQESGGLFPLMLCHDGLRDRGTSPRFSSWTVRIVIHIKASSLLSREGGMHENGGWSTQVHSRKVMPDIRAVQLSSRFTLLQRVQHVYRPQHKFILGTVLMFFILSGSPTKISTIQPPEADITVKVG